MVLEIIPIAVIPVIFGGVGGVVLGLLTYIEKRAEGEDFEFWKFVKSLIPAVLVGFASGVFAPNYQTAFAAGLIGKKLWETFDKVTK